MALFKRPQWQPPPDPALPLTLDEAAKLRAMVRDAFAAHGVEVLVLGAHAADREGRQYPLTDLAQRCKDAPEGEWLTLVGQFVAESG